MGRPFTFPDIMYLQFCKTILLMIKLRYDIFRSVADPCTRQTYIIQLTDLCNNGQSISYSGFYHVIVMSTHKDRSSTKMIFFPLNILRLFEYVIFAVSLQYPRRPQNDFFDYLLSLKPNQATDKKHHTGCSASYIEETDRNLWQRHQSRS